MKHISSEITLSNTNCSLPSANYKDNKLNAFVRNSILYSTVATALACVAFPTTSFAAPNTIDKEVTFDVENYGNKSINVNNTPALQPMVHLLKKEQMVKIWWIRHLVMLRSKIKVA